MYAILRILGLQTKCLNEKADGVQTSESDHDFNILYCAVQCRNKLYF